MPVASFDEILSPLIRPARLRPLGRGECQSSPGRRCPLCLASTVTYEEELAAKNSALRIFWSATGAGIPLDPLVPSPRGRAYRTVTKRKVFHARDHVRIGLIDPTGRGDGRFDPLLCAIEPKEHGDIYAAVRHELIQRRSAPLADELTYVIVKGTYAERMLLLNVRTIGTGIVQAANRLSRQVTARCPGIRGVFLYEGGIDDGYYQGMRGSRKLRKLYGASDSRIAVAGKRFSYGPLSFSQINHAMLDPLVGTAGSLLHPSPQSTLYDLYCGFGLFALSFRDRYRRVVGVEIAPPAVDDARRNAVRQKAGNAAFVRSAITAEALGKILRELRPADDVILDPPRGGTAQGVIETIAARGPGRVLHIFCAIDLMPQELRRWEACGYRLARAVPLDLFPGTPDIETLLLFGRKGK